MRTAIVFIAAAPLLAGCSGDRLVDEPRSVVLVKTDAAGSQQIRDAAQQIEGRLAPLQPQPGVQAWSVPQRLVPEFERELLARGAQETEPVPSAGFPLIGATIVQASNWSVQQRRIIESFTRELPPGAYRVSEDPPAEISFEMMRASVEISDVIPITLPDDTTVTLRRTGAQLSETGTMTWHGRPVEGEGSAIFVLGPGGTTGTLRIPKGTFSLLPLPGGRQLVFQSDRRRPPREHPPASPTGGRRRLQARGGQPPMPTCPGGQKFLDVLVVYTKPAAAFYPGVAPLAELAFRETQQSLAVSSIPTALRLAGGIEEVGVPDIPDDFNKTLDALVASAAVKQLRNARAADVVLMVVAGTSSAGLADEILATPDTAFAVVSLHWMAGPEYNFGHELGHLFGARHDPATDTDLTPFAHGHGYVDSLSEWRTIMAYDTCACPRIGYWASPQVSYTHNGKPRPTGSAPHSEDARVITAMTPRLNQFRCGPS